MRDEQMNGVCSMFEQVSSDSSSDFERFGCRSERICALWESEMSKKQPIRLLLESFTYYYRLLVKSLYQYQIVILESLEPRFDSLTAEPDRAPTALDSPRQSRQSRQVSTDMPDMPRQHFTTKARQ
jgi:hypothetical protein